MEGLLQVTFYEVKVLGKKDLIGQIKQGRGVRQCDWLSIEADPALRWNGRVHWVGRVSDLENALFFRRARWVVDNSIVEPVSVPRPWPSALIGNTPFWFPSRITAGGFFCVLIPVLKRPRCCRHSFTNSKDHNSDQAKKSQRFHCWRGSRKRGPKSRKGGFIGETDKWRNLKWQIGCNVGHVGTCTPRTNNGAMRTMTKGKQWRYVLKERV